jgi:uncharacterized protein (DUF2384 family)
LVVAVVVVVLRLALDIFKDQRAAHQLLDLLRL